MNRLILQQHAVEPRSSHRLGAYGFMFYFTPDGVLFTLPSGAKIQPPSKDDTCIALPQPRFSRFRPLSFCSPLLRESLLLSFPLATKMFRLASCLLPMDSAASSKGCPIWESRIYAYFQLLGISPITMPFLASRVLRDSIAEIRESEELMRVGRDLVDLHGQMVLLVNYSALNYIGTQPLLFQLTTFGSVTKMKAWLQIYEL
ncbi:hypothetical protein H5410_030607 [Solanum commersonii]|uniref:Uncharacterized protein n=1 Tax=Solanum commersonii TaxID=4109 RepID=A0A9J5YGN3_SOLCO|nr:hypothetical protein H5410_030607 [Solanum commersonii]